MVDCDGNLAAGRGVRQSIFDEIAQRPKELIKQARHRSGMLGADQLDGSSTRDNERRHEFGHAAANIAEIDMVVWRKLNSAETRPIQELLDHPFHAVDFRLQQRRCIIAVASQLQFQNGDGRPEVVRHVRDELLKRAVPGLQPAECQIDGPHQSPHVIRQSYLINGGHPRLRRDGLGLGDGCANRPQSNVSDAEVGKQHEKQERQPQPGDVFDELFQNGIKNHLAAGKDDLNEQWSVGPIDRCSKAIAHRPGRAGGQFEKEPVLTVQRDESLAISRIAPQPSPIGVENGIGAVGPLDQPLGLVAGDKTPAAAGGDIGCDGPRKALQGSLAKLALRGVKAEIQKGRCKENSSDSGQQKPDRKATEQTARTDLHDTPLVSM
nr:hypothetical protein [Pleomorphomonas oryzae]